MPVVAALVLIEVGGVLTALGKGPQDLTGDAALQLETVRILGNGFILTALTWGSAAALLVDGRLVGAASAFAVASAASLIGLIHSPLASGGLFWPGTESSTWPPRLAGAYGLLAALLVFLQPWVHPATDAAGSTVAQA